MNDIPETDVFDEWLAAYLDGRLAPADLPRLEEALKHSPESLRRYRDQMRIHALLRCRSGLPCGWQERETAPSPRRARLFPLFGSLAAAAAAIALLVAGDRIFRQNRQPTAPAAAKNVPEEATVKPAGPPTAVQEAEFARPASSVVASAATGTETIPVEHELDQRTQTQETKMNTNTMIRTLATTAVAAALPLATTAAAPSAPTFTFRGYINGTVNIAMQYDSTVTSYEVQMKATNATEDAYVPVSGTTTHYQHTGNGINFNVWNLATNLYEGVDIRIRACNADGNSDWSAPFTQIPHFAAKGTCIYGTTAYFETPASSAFDGLVYTFLDTPSAWAGLDLGKPVTIKSFRLAPRFIFGNRVANDIVQCANTADFSDATTLLQLPSQAQSTTGVTDFPFAAPVTARYFRFVGAKSGIADYFSAAEIEFEQMEPGFDAPVLSVNVADWTNQWAKLSWSYPANAHCVSGIVQRATSVGGPYTNIAEFAADTTTYTDTNLVLGLRQYYRIQGVCALREFPGAGKSSDPVSFLRGRRIERSWDNLGSLNASVSVLPSQGTGGVLGSVGYPYDGNKNTFTDIGDNPYIGLDLGTNYFISSMLLYPRSDNYCYDRINGVTFWGATNATLSPANALLTPSGVVWSNWYTFVSQDLDHPCRYAFFHHGRGSSWWGNVAEIGIFGCSLEERESALSGILTAPESLQSKRDSASHPEIHWTAGNNVASYTIQRALSLYGNWTNLATGLSPSTFFYVDTDVVNGMEYQYRIVAVNGENCATSGTAMCRYYAPGSGTGLLGTYSYPFLRSSYTNTESVLQTRVDPAINFTWADSDSLIDGTNAANNVRITWAGKLIVPFSGNYRFTADVNDGIALRIDGVFLFNHWTEASATYCVTNALSAGLHDIRIDYVQVSGAKKCVLKWGGAVEPEEVIPASQLIPAASFTDKIGDWNCRTFNEPQVGIHTNNADGSFTLSGSGGDVNGSYGTYTYVWQEFKGPFDFQAKVLYLSGSPSAKALLLASKHLGATNNVDNLVFAPFFMANKSWGVKAQTNATDWIRDHVSWYNFTNKTNPTWLRLTRAGTTFTAMAKTSENSDWQVYDTFEDKGDTFGRKLYIGMAVCNPDGDSAANPGIFKFSNVVLKPYRNGTVVILK